ncbi:hypothetical protein EHS25_001391 [Saitozyma podzolica]|uniref:Uncharacterized protein n=1 Tax=Saitozyma podzolica TaxID=1890683 RepID=A0A427YG32_9TREE|nr:hypothetical protein EHS25_001391 [Saitozyma podzolica]
MMGLPDEIYFEEFRWHDETGDHTMSRVALCNAWILIDNQYSLHMEAESRLDELLRKGETLPCTVESVAVVKDQLDKLTAIWNELGAFVNCLDRFEREKTIPTGWQPSTTIIGSRSMEQLVEAGTVTDDYAKPEEMTSVGFRIALWARRMLPLPDFPWLLELRRAQGRDDLTETPLTLLPEPDSESDESDGEDTVRVAFPTYHDIQDQPPAGIAAEGTSTSGDVEVVEQVARDALLVHRRGIRVSSAEPSEHREYL